MLTYRVAGNRFLANSTWYQMSSTREHPMDLTLCYSPGACSLAAHIALREAGHPFALKRIALAAGEHQQADYLGINPRGRIPTLVIDGNPIRELSGILTWIGQRDGRLYPAKGTIEAAKCAEWLAWLASSVHVTFAMIWRGERFANGEHLHRALRRHGLGLLRDQFNEIENDLQGKMYILGDIYSVVDPNLLVFYRWGWRMGFDMHNRYPAWSAHTARLLLRPAVEEALRVEGLSMEIKPDAWVADMGNGDMTEDRLSQFSDAWTAHDAEKLLSMMDPEAVYSASVGPEPGQTYRGSDELAEGFAHMLKNDAQGSRRGGRSIIVGDIAVAFWEFDFPPLDGRPARTVKGIDFFEFKGDKILTKDAYRKTTA
jgi:glutathione S-transferase